MEQEQSSVELKSFTPLLTDSKYETESTKTIESNKTKNQEEMIILKPGAKIRPQVTEEDAIRLTQRLYGISVRDISELVSYDDKNFRIHVDTNIKNPIVRDAWPHGYVLKIINALDSKKQKFFDAQTQLMLFLRQQGILCPKPVMNIFGKYYSIEKLNADEHLVRLLEFIPGKMFNDVIKTKHLFYQVGEYIAQIDAALERFHHDAYDEHKSIWMLESVTELPTILYAITDADKKTIVNKILHEFHENVLKHKANFVKGVIHGDFNEHNIIVTNTIPSKSDEFRVTGIIDFADTGHTLKIFELAIAIAYMLLQTCELDTAGYVIAGYQKLRHIPDNERKVLKICILARLCQSVVLGAYTHTLDPKNDYLLQTQENGWKMIHKLLPISVADLDTLWFETADNYLKCSKK